MESILKMFTKQDKPKEEKKEPTSFHSDICWFQYELDKNLPNIYSNSVNHSPISPLVYKPSTINSVDSAQKLEEAKKLEEEGKLKEAALSYWLSLISILYKGDMEIDECLERTTRLKENFLLPDFMCDRLDSIIKAYGILEPKDIQTIREIYKKIVKPKEEPLNQNPNSLPADCCPK